MDFLSLSELAVCLPLSLPLYIGWMTRGTVMACELTVLGLLLGGNDELVLL